MSAFCPVCQKEVKRFTELCPHIAAIVVPLRSESMGVVYEQGKAAGVFEPSKLGLSVLTPVGVIEGCNAYFSPNPHVYLDALHESWLTGVPVELTYPALWRRLGMEHETWHEE